MAAIFTTLGLTLFIICILLLIFKWVKTPYYRVDAKRMIRVLEMVLTGQATENDWHMTFGMTIRHSPVLEDVRQQCIIIEEEHFIGNQKPPYLFTRLGLDALQDVLNSLKESEKENTL